MTSHRENTAPPHVYLNHFAGEGGQWFLHRHGTKYIANHIHKAAMQSIAKEWGEMHIRADRAETALRTVMPMLRAYAEDLIRCVSIHNDPATISGADWRDIADVLEAVCSVEQIVGRPDDEFSPLLNAVLDARSWEAHQ